MRVVAVPGAVSIAVAIASAVVVPAVIAVALSVAAPAYASCPSAGALVFHHCPLVLRGF